MQATSPNRAALSAMRTASARPTTLRRVEKLRRLIAALSSRQMDVAAAAAFLGCSPAAARNHLYELLAARVIVPVPVRADGGGAGGDSIAYTLHADAAIVEAFVDTLREVHGARFIFAGKRSRKRGLFVGGRYFHIMLDDVGFALQICDEPVRRDPLVAALFGDA
ncbi:MAG: hypothetical protein V4724_00835 [Pseudomonadota bacterium]